MLIDDDIAQMSSRLQIAMADPSASEDDRRRYRLAFDTVRADTDRSQRFVLSPIVTRIVSELAVPETVEKTKTHLFLPAYITWIEWRGRGPTPNSTRHGVLLHAAKWTKDGLRTGDARYVCDHPVATNEKFVATVAGHFDFSGKGELFKFLLPLADERPNNPELYANLHDQLDSQSFGAWLGAALAVINTPRLTDLRE